RDGPVLCVLQPLSEPAVLDVLRHPVDPLVCLEQTLPELRYAHEPVADRPVDERVVAAPAMRVVVLVRSLLEHASRCGEIPEDLMVSFENVMPRIGPCGVIVAAVIQNRTGTRNAVPGAQGVVVLAVRGSEMNGSRSFLRGYEIRAEDLERIGRAGEKIDEGPVSPACESSAGQTFRFDVAGQLAGVPVECFAGEPHRIAVALHPRVFDCRTDRQ